MNNRVLLINVHNPQVAKMLSEAGFIAITSDTFEMPPPITDEWPESEPTNPGRQCKKCGKFVRGGERGQNCPYCHRRL
jgi:hypothetical protein